MNNKALIILSISIILSVVIHGLFFSNHFALQENSGPLLKLDQRSGDVWEFGPKGWEPLKNPN
jgi:hypothetical protein